ncbi:transcriptional repressor [Streptomyces silvisoli]|uniref:transcriptional repressor n=1 Tax=Streptomyces silvisoli TaxID=3034235 RepID=UPI0028BD9743|nr:transcriptional repressor [Streptomyces silvisoli]
MGASPCGRAMSSLWPVSAQELHALLEAAGRGVGLTTVYRALRALAATVRVDVVRDDAGERLYRRRVAEGHRH